MFSCQTDSLLPIFYPSIWYAAIKPIITIQRLTAGTHNRNTVGSASGQRRVTLHIWTCHHPPQIRTKTANVHPPKDGLQPEHHPLIKYAALRSVANKWWRVRACKHVQCSIVEADRLGFCCLKRVKVDLADNKRVRIYCCQVRGSGHSDQCLVSAPGAS